MASTTMVAAARPAILTVINPSGQRTRAVLSRTPFLMGRQSDNHLVLRDNRISRVHARILFEQGDYYLEDLGSRHGTYHNNQRMETKVKLFHSDNITFGFPDGYQLVFLNEERDVSKLADQVSTNATTTTSVTAAAVPFPQHGGSHNLAKLRSLVEVARALQSSLSIREVLESVVDAALTVTNTERGFLLLKKVADLHVEVARDRQGQSLRAEELKVPTRLIQRALNNRRELLSMHFDPHIHGAEEPDVSVEALDLRSVVCIPLVKIKTEISPDTMLSSSNDTIGLIYLDSKVDMADLSAGNREILQTLALEASTVIENARLLEQERAKQRMDEELRIARNIQQSLLPRSMPREGWFRASGSSISSQEVGGDYFDVSPVGADWWTFVVADVSGKGVSSALLAALLQGAFQLGPTEPAQIQAMISRLNRYLYERTEGEKYATLFYGAMRSDGWLLWTNAGHCAPIRLSADGSMESMRASAMPVGIMADAQFPVRESRLKAGDKIVIFSDGLTEARDAAGQFFDTERIRKVLGQATGLTAFDLHSALLRTAEAFTEGQPQMDDMTLVVAEFNPYAS